MLEDLNWKSVKVGLKMNRKKTKIIIDSLANKQEFNISSQVLECLQEYVYLGQLLTGEPAHKNIKKKLTEQ